MNYITASFDGYTHTSETAQELWQWDYGQKLIINGLSLPEQYEVHFCNPGDEGTKSQLGNQSGVLIPDEYLKTGKNIIAYIFLHDSDDDGHTEYKITIKVKQRPRPTEIVPTPTQASILDEALRVLQLYTSVSMQYQSLQNKPSIGGVEVDGDKTLQEYGIQPALDFDSTPEEGSSNPITSGGVYLVLAEIYDAITDLRERVHELEIAPKDIETGHGAFSAYVNNDMFVVNGDSVMVDGDGLLCIDDDNIVFDQDGIITFGGDEDDE